MRAISVSFFSIPLMLGTIVFMTACGGGGGSSSSAAYPGTVEYTTVNPNAPDNYAAPALAVHYNTTLMGTLNQTSANLLSDKGATLGRVLFNDKRLSINDTKSCASCHSQANGFSDTAQFSTGFSGAAFTSAHSMRLANAGFYQGSSMFWDKRAASLEAQATVPIQNAVEMGFDAAHGGFAAVISKMQALPYYPELFGWVYGDSAITEPRVQNALAQYQRAIISSNSKWDRAYAVVFSANGSVNSAQNFGRPLSGVDIPAADRFSASEENGRALFIASIANGGKGCAGCHAPPTFSLTAASRSNGLDAGETIIFKSPSLKNVGLAGRFMHDGRFSTLDQVLNHYATGIQAGAARDNRLPIGGIAMTVQEQADIVAFLNTLTDSTLLTDSRFADPFKK